MHQASSLLFLLCKGCAARGWPQVLLGGKLKSRKGINVPELQIDCSALTVKDREDAAYLLSMGVDYIALSFAQKGQDIQDLIDLMDAEGVPADQRPAIIPKIEKPAALRNIDEILDLSDGLMVAVRPPSASLPSFAPLSTPALTPLRARPTPHQAASRRSDPSHKCATNRLTQRRPLFGSVATSVSSSGCTVCRSLRNF